VNVAVYVPSAWSVVELIVPVLVPPTAVKTTADPPEVRLLPAASFACSVSVTALPPSTVPPPDTLTTELAVEAGPGVTVTVGSAVVTGVPPIVASIVVAVPAATPVKAAVYVPFPLSVVAPIVPVLAPPEDPNSTTSPPEVKLLPATSFACRVSVTALPDATVPSETATVEWAVDAGPGVTATVGSGSFVTATPPIVAPIVRAVPATIPVKLAVYVPFKLSVVAPIVPVLVPPAAVNTTVEPPLVRLLPAGSLACSVSVTALPEATDPLETLTTDWAVEIAPTVTVTVGSDVVTATPPIVAPMVVAVPATAPVNVAVYVPFPTSFVAPIVPVLAPTPPEAVNTTVDPPADRLLPNASFACSWSVTLLPPATVPADTVTID
jgi:hypothetical protein